MINYVLYILPQLKMKERNIYIERGREGGRKKGREGGREGKLGLGVRHAGLQVLPPQSTGQLADLE